jgi:hypothetical protein
VFEPRYGYCHQDIFLRLCNVAQPRPGLGNVIPGPRILCAVSRRGSGQANRKQRTFGSNLAVAGGQPKRNNHAVVSCPLDAWPGPRLRRLRHRRVPRRGDDVAAASVFRPALYLSPSARSLRLMPTYKWHRFFLTRYLLQNGDRHKFQGRRLCCFAVCQSPSYNVSSCENASVFWVNVVASFMPPSLNEAPD